MKLNKYKTQETFCYSFITLWVIGILLIMMTSCTNSKELLSHKYNQKVECYDFTN